MGFCEYRNPSFMFMMAAGGAFTIMASVVRILSNYAHSIPNHCILHAATFYCTLLLLLCLLATDLSRTMGEFDGAGKGE